MGLTGCQSVETLVVSVGLDNIVTLQVKLANILNLNLVTGIDINGILGIVTDQTHGVLNEIINVDVAQLQSVIGTVTGLLDGKVNEVIYQQESVVAPLKQKVIDNANILTATAQQVESLTEDADVAQVAQEIVKTAFDTKNLEQAQLLAEAKNLETQLAYADAQVAACEKKYYEAKLVCAQNSHADVQLCVELLESAKVQLEISLGRCFHIKELIAQVLSHLQVKVGVNVELLNIYLNLKAKVDLSLQGIVRSVLDIKALLIVDVDLDIFLKEVLCLLTEIVGGIDLELLDIIGLDDVTKVLELDIAVGPLVGGVVNTVGGLVDGVTGTLLHKVGILNILGGCFSAVAQNPDVYVTECNCPAIKRSTDQCYHVTIGKETTVAKNTVDLATQENGMVATTTSSASSLVFSFLTIFVSVLCFFLNNK